MPLLQNGMYAKNEDFPYEVEETYYLQFHIKSALIAIHKLTTADIKTEDFESVAQYYHFYSDHLLFSWGQITNRFKLNTSRGKAVRCNYLYNKTNFPILSCRYPRNTIEHLDENNRRIIEEGKGVGGFNFIDNTTPEILSNFLRKERHTHPYTYDYKKKKLLIERVEDDNTSKRLTINLQKLEKELKTLKKNVDDFYDFIKDKI